MPDITKIKVSDESESSYQLYPRNEEFAKRSDTQPDWNQNDVSAPDYVKNRTHWTEPEILDVIFQQDDVALYNATDFLQSKQSLVFSEELVVGDTYNVNIDGVDNYVVCYTIGSDVHLGKEWPDRFMLFGSGSSAKLYLYQFDYGSTVRLTVTHIIPSKIHKLDPKYLPNADLEITVTLNNTEPGKDLSYSKITAENMKITEGSVEGVCAKLAVGIIPKVVIKYFLSYTPGYSDLAIVTDLVSTFRYGEYLNLVYYIGENSIFHQHEVRFNMDGTYISSETPKKLAFESYV